MGTTGQPGVIPRFFNELFVRLQELSDTKLISASSVQMAFFEIYNERIHDLLVDEPKQTKQMVFMAYWRDIGLIGLVPFRESIPSLSSLRIYPYTRNTNFENNNK